MTAYQRADGRVLTLAHRLGAGGEAAVYAVAGEPALAAKIYHRPTPAHAAQLRAMLTNPPDGPARQRGHSAIAWPTEPVFDAQGSCAGFLMPRIDYRTSIPLLKLYNPHDRRQAAPRFTWEYLLRAARNLAGVVATMHARGYVLGDVNESNLLVTGTALVTLVDCDSHQVPAGNGRVFRCPVGKAEYTPPELQGCDFSAVDRGPAHDSFGLAVLIFLLLMEGVHPFAGVWQGAGAPPPIAQHIRVGNWPYTGARALLPPRHALPLGMLPPGLQRLLVRCFRDGHRNPGARPTPQQWQRALAEAERQLTRCRVNGQHVYGRHLRRCPWCDRMAQGIPDPFPQPGRQSTPPIASAAAVSLPALHQLSAAPQRARGAGSGASPSPRGVPVATLPAHTRVRTPSRSGARRRGSGRRRRVAGGILQRATQFAPLVLLGPLAAWAHILLAHRGDAYSLREGYALLHRYLLAGADLVGPAIMEPGALALSAASVGIAGIGAKRLVVARARAVMPGISFRKYRWRRTTATVQRWMRRQVRKLLRTSLTFLRSVSRHRKRFRRAIVRCLHILGRVFAV